MEPCFSEHFAAADSPLGDREWQLNQSADSYDGWMQLGKTLSCELRYRKAILAYTQAIGLSPGRIEAYRSGAGNTSPHCSRKRRWRILNGAGLWAETRAISAMLLRDETPSG